MIARQLMPTEKLLGKYDHFNFDVSAIVSEVNDI